MSQKIEFYKVRSTGEIINATIEFAKQNFKSLLKTIFFISGPFILIGSISYAYLIYSMVSVTKNMGGTGPMSNPFASIGSEIAFCGLVILIAFFLFYSAVYEFINLYVNKNLEKIELSDVWGAIKKDFWLLVKNSGRPYICIFLDYIIHNICFCNHHGARCRIQHDYSSIRDVYFYNSGICSSVLYASSLFVNFQCKDK